MRAVAAIATALSLWHTISAAQTEPPRWRWEAAEAIEWTATAGRALLIATSDGVVRALSIDDGAALLDAPLRAGRGVRFIGAANERAYVADARSVACFEWMPEREPNRRTHFRLAWFQAVIKPSVRTDDGDPEFQNRIVDAAASPRGALAIDRRGVLRLLNEQTGAVRWRFACTPSRAARIFAGDQRAAVFFPTGGRPGCLIVDLEAAAPRTRRADLPSLRVLHTRWVGESLYVAATDRCVVVDGRTGTVISRAYDATFEPPRALNSIIATDSQLFGRTPATTRRATGQAERVYLTMLDEELVMFDMRSGQTVLQAALPTCESPASGLRAADGRLWSATAGGLCVIDLRGGPASRFFPLDAPASQVVDGRLAGGRLRIVTKRAALDSPHYALATIDLAASPEPAVRGVLLDDAPRRARSVIWADDRVLLVARESIAAYTLDR